MGISPLFFKGWTPGPGWRRMFHVEIEHTGRTMMSR